MNELHRKLLEDAGLDERIGGNPGNKNYPVFFLETGLEKSPSPLSPEPFDSEQPGDVRIWCRSGAVYWVRPKKTLAESEVHVDFGSFRRTPPGIGESNVLCSAIKEGRLFDVGGHAVRPEDESFRMLFVSELGLAEPG